MATMRMPAPFLHSVLIPLIALATPLAFTGCRDRNAGSEADATVDVRRPAKAQPSPEQGPVRQPVGVGGAVDGATQREGVLAGRVTYSVTVLSLSKIGPLARATKQFPSIELSDDASTDRGETVWMLEADVDVQTSATGSYEHAAPRASPFDPAAAFARSFRLYWEGLGEQGNCRVALWVPESGGESGARADTTSGISVRQRGRLLFLGSERGETLRVLFLTSNPAIVSLPGGDPGEGPPPHSASLEGTIEYGLTPVSLKRMGRQERWPSAIPNETVEVSVDRPDWVIWVLEMDLAVQAKPPPSQSFDPQMGGMEFDRMLSRKTLMVDWFSVVWDGLGEDGMTDFGGWVTGDPESVCGGRHEPEGLDERGKLILFGPTDGRAVALRFLTSPAITVPVTDSEKNGPPE